MVTPPTNRYAFFPFFVLGALFIVLAPVFWLHVEAPADKPGLRTTEHADLHQRILPSFQYGFSELRRGRLPLWNPRQLCGAPFLADPATGVFQPLNAVFLLLPVERAMAAQAFLALFLMALFFVLFARALDAAYVPAMIGGIVYAFNGATAAAMSHPELAATLAWTPLLFWALREYPREWRLGVAGAGGLAAAMLAVAGSPALFAAVLALALPYGALRGTQGIREGEKGALWRGLGGYALMPVIAAGVAAAQWIPTAFWLADLENPWATLWRLEFAGQVPARLRDVLAHMLAAQPDVLPRMAYCGVAALAVLPAAFFQRSARLEVVFFAIAAAGLFYAATAGAAALGDFPREAFIFPAIFGVTTIATVGFDRVLATGRDPRSPLIWGPALAMLVAAGAIFFLASAPARGRILPLVLVLLPFLVFRFRWVGGCCGAAVALLIFVDLYGTGVNQRLHPYASPSGFVAAHRNFLIAAEEAALDGRAVLIAQTARKTTPLNLGMLGALRMADGALLPLSRDQAGWWEALTGNERSLLSEDPAALTRKTAYPGLLNWMAVRVVLASVDSGITLDAWRQAGLRLRSVRLDNGIQCFVNDAALPRAYWVPAWRPVNGVDEAVETLLKTTDGDPRQWCVVEAFGEGYTRLAALLPPAPSDAAPMPVAWAGVWCRIVEEDAGLVRLRVESPQPGVLVLADTFAPGWRAEVNGAKAPILQVNGIFRGLGLPGGAHEIVFRYRPIPFWAGLATSLATLGLLAMAGLVRIARRP